jgi:hypothetical protein
MKRTSLIIIEKKMTWHDRTDIDPMGLAHFVFSPFTILADLFAHRAYFSCIIRTNIYSNPFNFPNLINYRTIYIFLSTHLLSDP